MRRRPWPLRCLRRRSIRPMGLQPASRQHPAGMPDHGHAGLGQPPARGPRQHLPQAFATTRAVMREVRHPGIDLRARDVRPRLAVPGAEIGFQQGVVDHVPPAQLAKVAAHGPATPQRRGADQARQPLPQRVPVDATCQAPGLARVDAKVGAADAAPRMADRPRMPPGDEAGWLQRHGCKAHHPGLIMRPVARRGARPAGWPARPVAGWHPGCPP